MSPVPKKKHTRSRSNKRANAATKRGKLLGFVRCQNCKKLRVPHRACSHCGHYR